MYSPHPARLVTLVHVARHGSLTAAAQSLGVTASAVSQQMSQLEGECGVRLIDRGSRGVSLTGAGLVLLERAEHVLRELEGISATMAQLQGRLAGRVRVASIASAAAAIVLPAVHVLRRTAPEVTLTVSISEPSSSLEAVMAGGVDVALIDVYDHVPLALPEHLLIDELLTEPLVLVTPTDSAVPPHPALARLKDQKWVIPPADAACGAATRFACRAAGFEPDIAWETDDLMLLVAAVSSGEGIALLPRRAIADSAAPVAMRRLIAPVLHRRLLLVARHEIAQRPTIQACCQALRDACDERTLT